MSESLLYVRNTFLLVVTAVLIVMIFVAFIRTLKGPRITDRIISINMIGTITISIIAVVGIVLDQTYLVDISLIYAMISFLAVVVLCKIYMGVYAEKKKKEQEEK